MEIIAINREVQFQVSNATLSSINQIDKQDQKLDYLESLVLTLLVEKVNHLVTYEDFLSHWRSSEATENSLSRVVSLLRKKLKQAGLSDNVIKNTAKKGYTLVAETELLSIELQNPLRSKSKHIEASGIGTTKVDNGLENSASTPEHHQSSFEAEQVLGNTGTTRPNHKSAELVNNDACVEEPQHNFDISYSSSAVVKASIAILCVLVLTVTFSFVYFSQVNSNVVNVDKATYTELFDDTDIKIELIYNHESDLIAYSKKSSHEELWQLEVRHRFNGASLVLSELGKNISKPAWLGKNELVYRLYDDNNCEIRKATLTDPLHSYSSVKLFPCNPNSFASAIAKFDERSILITDAEFNSTASSLFIGDIITGRVRKIDIENSGGYGFYNVLTSSFSSLVALLSSSDGNEFKIQLFDSAHDWKLVWEEQHSAINFSVGWDGSSLSYRNENGGISVVSFDGSNEIRRANIHTLRPTRNISSVPNGLMMIGGDLTSSELSLLNFHTNESFNFTKGNSARNKLPVFYLNNSVIYVSNKTGINQLWLYNTETKEQIQISSFKVNKKIYALKIDEKNQLVAIQVENTVELYSLLENNTLSPYLLKIKGMNPEFYQDMLIYAAYDDSSSVIEAISLRDYERTPLVIDGGFVAKHAGEKLFYSSLYLPGIWLYQDEESIQLVSDKATNWFVDNEYIYYEVESGEFFQFHVESGDVSSFDRGNCRNPEVLTSLYCVSRDVVQSRNSLVILEWE